MGKEWPQFGHFMSVGIDPGSFYKSKFLSINQLRKFRGRETETLAGWDATFFTGQTSIIQTITL
jgi:hypothetical protein